MPTTETAAVAASAFIGLWVGHQLGDHPIQRNADMQAKAAPDDFQIAAGTHPWSGWAACLRHVATYGLAQVATLALVSLVAPLTLVGALTALLISTSTHAVIDRRWIVRAILRAKQALDWPDGPYHVGEALHDAMLLVAAVLATIVTTAAELAVVSVAGLALIAGGLAIERVRARSAPTRMGDPTRL